MTRLSPSGVQFVQTLANRYGLSTDAITHMLIAVQNGNGTMAQFGHPEFCGSGQWMRGGMTMVSDLFNNNLKMLVNNVCNDISNELANNQSSPMFGSFQSQSQNGSSNQTQASGQMGSQNSLFLPDPTSNWWPQNLGAPSSTGSQNNLRYAYFAGSRRLAVTTGGTPWVYDTLDHQINGFSQQQGGGQSITFTSQYGTVDLSTLPVVNRDGQSVSVSVPPTNSATSNPVNTSVAEMDNPQGPPPIQVDATTNDGKAVSSSSEDVMAMLERLAALKEKGHVTDEQFETKKRDLLDRL